MLKGKCVLCGTNKSTFGKLTKGGRPSDGSTFTSYLKEGKGWTDLPFELHSPGYQFLGPGTKLNKRLDENKNSLPHSKPINKLDEIAMNHDICYEKYPNTKERNKICDKEMVNDIKKNKKTTSINEWIMRRAAKNIIGAKKVLGLGY